MFFKRTSVCTSVRTSARPMWRTSLLGTLLLSPLALAAVSEQQAQQLQQQLTPVGAERAANADGSIPAWNGGYRPQGDDKTLSNPYRGEKPLYRITADNAASYKERLTPGQLALLKTYPQSFYLDVYPSHRSAAYPDDILAQTKDNATQVTLSASGSSLEHYTQGVPFPIPASAEEVLWNHLTRYRGGRVERTVHRMAPQVNGSYIASRLKQTQVFNSNISDAEAGDNMLFYFIGETQEPARLAGTMTLVHETLDQLQSPRQAWIYNAGQRRVRRAPTVAYDSPQNNSDGQATSDNMDMFNGAFDRYNWTLKGKQELLIPYNNYRLHDKSLSYDQIIQPGHINSEFVRYEPHRVWVIEGELKDSQRHVYSKRTFYIDEDTWQIAVADHFDERGELWRVSMAYHINFYHDLVPWMTAEATYDLSSRRYLLSGISNEVDSEFRFGGTARKRDFKPDSLRRMGGKN